ncbi:MAG: transposase [Tannerella sp.]|nr:transposase [Tannerella sp.]
MKKAVIKKTVMKQNVGIDVSKDDFKVSFAVLTEELSIAVKGSRTFPNTAKGFESFEAWAGNKMLSGMELHFTMEATGVYYEGLVYYLQERHYPVHVVLPNRSKKYGQSLGMESKTDKIDAKLLSQMGLERKLRKWEPFSPHFRILKQLTRERDALVQNRTSALNHRHAYQQGKTLQASVQRIEEQIDFTDKQIEEIEKEIESIIPKDTKLKDRLNYILSIKGVGLLTAVCILIP